MDYKNNHIVPESVLHRFKNGKNEFFYANKNRPDEPIKHRNPSKVFYGKDIYVSQDVAGNRDTSLESEIFKGIEDRAIPVIDKIIAAARLGRVPNLLPIERMAWDEFFMAQQKRSPEFYSKVPFMGSPNQAVDWAIERAELEHPEIATPELISEFRAETDFSRLHHAANVDALGQQSPLTSTALRNRGIMVCTPHNKKCSFVIGSQPISWMKAEGQTLADAETLAFLPISHDVAVSPGSKTRSEVLFRLNDTLMRAVNVTTYANSIEVGSRSKELLMSLRNPR